MGWDEALARSDAVAAAYFDTVSFEAIGMAAGRAVNAPASPDPARPRFSFKGSLDIEPELSAVSNSSRPNAGERSIRHISRICLTAEISAWPWLLRQGDHVRIAGALYAVAVNPDSDGTARVAIWLNKVSS